MAEEKKETAKKEGKTRRPTAKKRDIQAAKRNLRNRAFKSRVRTALNAFEKSLSEGNAAAMKQNLNDVYSLLDKGVKTNVFKLNKASRLKSRLHSKTAAKA